MWIFLAVVTLQRGWVWPYTRPTWLFLLLAAALSFGGVLAWAVIGEVREWRRQQRHISPMDVREEWLPGPITRAKITKATKRSAVFVLLAAVCLFGGYRWGWARAKGDSLRARYHYTNVLVADAIDSRHFVFQPAGMNPWPISTTCFPVDLRKGERLVYMDFKKYPDCKDLTVDGAYECYQDEQHRCIIYREEVARGY